MQLPLEMVFRRGAIFYDGVYSELDDPALEGQSKGKFFVVLNNSAQDDPIVYLLTTSEKPKHKNAPYMFGIPAGKYQFFPKNTLINVALAGADELASDVFEVLYEDERLVCKGHLDQTDVDALLKAIEECPVVDSRFKRTLKTPAP